MTYNDLWIPVKRRDMTKDEEAALRDQYEIDPEDEEELAVFENLMPKNGQKIIVTYEWMEGGKKHVWAGTDFCQFDKAVYKLKLCGSWRSVTAWQPYPVPYTESPSEDTISTLATSGGKITQQEHNALYKASEALIGISERMTERKIKELKYSEPRALPKNYSAGMIQGIARSLCEIGKAKEG